MTSRLSHEEFFALNDEIAALIRAGLPLDLGLNSIPGSGFGQRSALTQRLAERIAMGASLENALRDEGDHIPAIYIAIIEAGMRSGHLPDALELVSEIGRQLLELHRGISLALIYPGIVLVLGYLLVVSGFHYCIPQIIDSYRWLEIPETSFARFVRLLIETRDHWQIELPVAFIVIWLLMGWNSRRAGASAVGQLFATRIKQFLWMPWVMPIIRAFDYSLMARLLRLLLQHQTPMPVALQLAGHATGNPIISESVQQASLAVQRGTSLSDAIRDDFRLAPYFKAILSMGERHGNLDAALNQAGSVYHRKAEHYLHVARVVIPATIIVLLGGGFTLICTVSLLGPLQDMLSALTLHCNI